MFNKNDKQKTKKPFNPTEHLERKIEKLSGEILELRKHLGVTYKKLDEALAQLELNSIDLAIIKAQSAATAKEKRRYCALFWALWFLGVGVMIGGAL